MLQNSNNVSRKAWAFKHNTKGRGHCFYLLHWVDSAFQQGARIPPFLSLWLCLGLGPGLSLSRSILSILSGDRMHAVQPEDTGAPVCHLWWSVFSGAVKSLLATPRLCPNTVDSRRPHQTGSLSLSLFLSLSVSVSVSPSLALAVSLSVSLSLSLSLPLSLSFSHSLALALTLSVSLSLSPSVSLSQSISNLPDAETI